MKKKRVALVVIVLLVLGADGVVWWLAWPMPYQRAYRNIPLGMPLADVERLLPDPPPALSEELVATAFEWEGKVGDEHRRAHGEYGMWAGEHPVVRHSQLFQLPEASAVTIGREGPDGPDLITYKDRRTGRVVASERDWGPAACGEALLVLFDADERVVEKLYVRYLPTRTWWDNVREHARKAWPF